MWVNDTDNVLSGLTQTYDSNGVATPNISSVANLAPAGNLLQDFGYSASLPMGSIGDTIWYDVNNSGGNQSTQGAEPGIAGVTLRLFQDHNGDGTADDVNGDGLVNNSDAIATTATDIAGKYEFTNLPLDTYIVWVDTTTLPSGFNTTPTYDPQGAADSQSQVALTPAVPARWDQDFSYAKPAGAVGSIGDTIWLDLNNSGTATPDAGEPGLAGVVVLLYDGSNNLVATATTDGQGKYLFTNLPVSGGGTTYTVVVNTGTLPPGLQVNATTGVPVPTYDPNGGADSRSTATLTTALPNNLNQDFSYRPTTTTANLRGIIGDTVWFDLNNNGTATPDAGEPGLADVRVKLHNDVNRNGVLDAGDLLLSSTYTDANGRYLFENLSLAQSGQSNYKYLVQVDTATLPSYVSTTPSYDPTAPANSVSSATLSASSPATGSHINFNQDFSYPPLTNPGLVGDASGWISTSGGCVAGRRRAGHRGRADGLLGPGPDGIGNRR